MTDSSPNDPKPQRPEPRQLTLLGPPARPPPPPPPKSATGESAPKAEDGRDDEPQRSEALVRGDVVAGRYRIDTRIGCGGMAAVYLAHHVEIEAAVAIKVLDPELAALRGTAERFLLEAKASSLVHHPNVVAISDYGRLDGGLPYIVMEYLVGEDLEDLLRRSGPLPWSRVRGIALQICAALQAAHDVGVVHRDVKLQNCFRQDGSGGQDFIKVLDFGIAKVTEDLLADRRALARTTEGIVVGTPDYMAPEQGRRGTVDHRADIYSLGVVLYHLVAGRLPFTAKHPIEQMAQHIYEEPPAPSEVRPGIDPRVDALILRALEKNPGDRYASMREFADAIDRLETSSTAVIAVPPDLPAPMRRGRAGALLGAAALVTLLAIVWATRAPEVGITLPGPLEVSSPSLSAVAASAPPPTATVAAPAVEVPRPLPEETVLEVVDVAEADELVEPIGIAQEPTLVVEPAAAPSAEPDDPSLQAIGLQEALRRFTEDDDVEEAAEREAERRDRKRRTKSRAKTKPRPKASEPKASPPPELPAPPVAKPTPPQAGPSSHPGTTQKPSEPFRPVDPLKNPYD